MGLSECGVLCGHGSMAQHPFCLGGMPAKHQPDLIYLRYVPLWKVHVFTVVQLTCLVLLWVIKASAAAVVFPMMVSLFSRFYYY